jgi:hypothetical protein
LLVLTSCGGGTDRETSEIITASGFELTDAELDAFAAEAGPSADTMRVVPGPESVSPPEMPGTLSVADVKGASTSGNGGKCKPHKRTNCFICKVTKKFTCSKCGKWSCKKCNKCGDCKCSKKDKCKPAKCDRCKQAKCTKCSQCGDCKCSKKNSCKPKVKKCNTCGQDKCDKCTRCGDCQCPCKDKCGDQCQVVGVCNLSERFFSVCDCDNLFGDICYRAKVLFEDCPCGKCVKSGVEVIFCRDGQEVGRATTDDEGWAYFCEPQIGVGSYTGTVKVDTFSADLRAVVYDSCRHACASGKGKLPSINGGKYAYFNYEFHFNGTQLVYGGTYSFQDGDSLYLDQPITWFLQVGNDVHFGDGNFYMMATANGIQNPTTDYAEIYVWDRAYENKGTLLNGRIRLSWGVGLLPPGELPTF